jgi:hypothetical protein
VPLANGKWAQRGEIQNYFDDLFHDAYTEWHYWRRFGLGNGQGWRNEREIHLKFVDIFESEYESYQSHKMEKSRKK